jgi:protein-L-isoaspartate(D-aspartate) O-methyltransferase
MVAHLRERRGLTDPRVAAVLGRVPRHVFVPGADLSEAYADEAIVTRYRDGRPVSSASQPAIVAAMLEQLHPPEGGSVLEIGAGTGYNAALLSALVGASGRVVTIDIDPEVADQARSHLAEAGATNVEVICADGAQGWVERAPYDGIIVTAGASDLAPAWARQLAPGGRLVLPLSIRGVQQCVALTPADGHLRSVAVCGCGFMPLTGVMAHSDQRLPVPGHPGVHVEAAAETDVDPALVADVLGHPGSAVDTGITARSQDVFASLRPWLAFREPALATLIYSGPPDAADASAVPAVADFTVRGLTRRATPCLPGPAGLAVLDFRSPDVRGPDVDDPDVDDPDVDDPDVDDPDVDDPVVRDPRVTSGDPARGRMLRLTVRGYGEARQQTARLQELIMAWDAAGRPGTDHLRIDAYPSGIRLAGAGRSAPPDAVGIPHAGTGGIVHAAPHTTFVISSSRA